MRRQILKDTGEGWGQGTGMHSTGELARCLQKLQQGRVAGKEGCQVGEAGMQQGRAHRVLGPCPRTVKLNVMRSGAMQG